MSILLNGYFPEGIVFAADKNVTSLYPTRDGSVYQDVETGAAVKVIPWPGRRAVVGFCGLGELVGIPLWEWMRQFVASTRDFDDLGALATELGQWIRRDFDRTYPEHVDISTAGLWVHLGGFKYENGVAVPAMYYISNAPGFEPDCGEYHWATRQFNGPSDQLSETVEKVGAEHFRQWLVEFNQQGRFIWFNNGTYFKVFNVFKEAVWKALEAVWNSDCDWLSGEPTLTDRVAYCKMAVDVYGSFFEHHFLPSGRNVGGGTDAEWVPWPEPVEPCC